MSEEYITKELLEVGAVYECKARNFVHGCWDGEKFLYKRQKFMDVFTDSEYHWDDGAPYGTVKPLRRIS